MINLHYDDGLDPLFCDMTPAGCICWAWYKIRLLNGKHAELHTCASMCLLSEQEDGVAVGRVAWNASVASQCQSHGMLSLSQSLDFCERAADCKVWCRSHMCARHAGYCPTSLHMGTGSMMPADA